MNPAAEASHRPTLADVAARLKTVKDAYREFLTLWAADRLAEESAAMETLIRDLDDVLDADGTKKARDLLYRTCRLDD